jgi:endonuclease-3
MVATADAKRHAAQIVRRLKTAYPDAHCALHFKTPLQLLVATILSAQCTDTRVNIVTKDLFRKYPDARSFAASKQADLEKAIQSTGFFRNKAKNIRACCSELVESYGGELPQDLSAMVRLAGVGRKTANVVLGTAFGIPTGVVVDTHVGRLSKRMGLSRHSDPVKIERDLMELVPKREWIDFGHRMIAHGRRICTARKPKCEECPLGDVCPRIGVKD